MVRDGFANPRDYHFSSGSHATCKRVATVYGEAGTKRSLYSERRRTGGEEALIIAAEAKDYGPALRLLANDTRLISITSRVKANRDVWRER